MYLSNKPFYNYYEINFLSSSIDDKGININDMPFFSYVKQAGGNTGQFFLFLEKIKAAPGEPNAAV